MPRRDPALAACAALVLLAACEDSDPTGPAPDPADPTPFQRLLDAEVALETNPTGVAPLGAELTVTAPIPVRVAFTVLGTGDEEPPERASEAPAREHVLPVLGLLPATDHPIRIRLEAEGAELERTLHAVTDTLPSFLPDVAVTTAVEGMTEPGWTLSNLAIGQDEGHRTHPILYDHRGRIRLYLDLSGLGAFLSPIERLENGNLILGTSGEVMEIDLLGRIVRSWSIGPTWRQHHDIVEKPDGNLIVAVDNLQLDTVEDHVVELDRESGRVVRVWDLRQVLDVDRGDFVDDDRDWLHVNSVWHDASDGGLVVSARHQGVFKVTADNELVWILAPHRGWGPAGPDGQGPETAPFLLTAVDADGVPLPDSVQAGAARTDGFDWSWGQHAAMLLPDGNLFLLDNGDDRHFGERRTVPYTRGVEYEVDEEARTVRQVWAYGRERGPGFFASFVSDADYLPATGNRLIMPGIVNVGSTSRAFVTEVTPDRSVVYEAVLRFKNAQGPRPDLVYRSERMTLYPE